MHVSYIWFKSGYVLPPHSHDGDCLYYILAGSLLNFTGDKVKVFGGVSGATRKTMSRSASK